MDIGRPNNFPRILKLYNENHDAITEACWGASYSDADTERHLRKVYNETGYLMCPHTTVGHMAREEFAEDIEEDFLKITVATAHPAKFADSVERIIRADVEMPTALSEIFDRTPRVHNMAPTLGALADYLDASKT